MRRRRKRSDGESGDVFLDGTQSTLADFGRTAGEGFAEAWHASEGVDDDSSLAESFQPLDDKRSRRARDLDRRSRRWVVALVVVVVLGVAAGVAARRGVFAPASDDEPTASLGDGELASIGDRRTYEVGTGSAETRGALAGDSFIAQGTADDPVPTDDTAQPTAAYARFLWAGRAHVAVLQPGIESSGRCVVASLVADDFRVVDLASAGTCPPEFGATGDRVACRGADIVVLEVWPFDPDAVVEQPDVASLRVRVESTNEETGAVLSVRGSDPVDDGFLDDIATMTGRPGDLIEIRVGDRTASCTLLDRAEIPVQLL